MLLEARPLCAVDNKPNRTALQAKFAVVSSCGFTNNFEESVGLAKLLYRLGMKHMPPKSRVVDLYDLQTATYSMK